MKKENTYNQQTAKFIASVIQNMPDVPTDVMQGWIENPKDLKRVLQNVLCPPQLEFKVWKTLEIGGGFKSGEDFALALKNGGYYVGDWGRDILRSSKFKGSFKEEYVDLVLVTPSMLGFTSSASAQDINWQAQKRGLDLCHCEVGPQLRLQYPDQPLQEWLHIGMRSISLGDGVIATFSVGNKGHGLFLDGGSVLQHFQPSDQLVYVMPRR